MKDKESFAGIEEFRRRLETNKKSLSLLNDIDLVKVIQKDEIIYLQDDPADTFYYIKKGKIKTYVILNNDVEKHLIYYDEGSVFGLGSFYTKTPRFTSAIASEKSELVVINRSILDQLTLKYPELYKGLLMFLAQDLQIMVRQVIAASGDRANIRIARYLLREIRRHKITTDQDINIIKVTQDQVANQFGYSRATANRVLRNLVLNKLVKVGYGFIEVIDQERLYEYCHTH
jgi:CRP/FNR family transcriptional regulator